jgi:hypothetical protein
MLVIEAAPLKAVQFLQSFLVAYCAGWAAGDKKDTLLSYALSNACKKTYSIAFWPHFQMNTRGHCWQCPVI